MRIRRFVVPAVFLALVCAALPATALSLSGVIAPVVVDPAIAPALAKSATADVIVGFKSAPTDADIRSLAKAGFTGPFVRYQIVPAVAATATAAAMKNVLTNARVKRVEFDAVLGYTLDRAVAAGRVTPVRNATYQTNAGTGTGGFKGKGVTVAVVDSGIDGRHPDLRAKELKSLSGGNYALSGNFIMAGRSNGNEALNILEPSLFGPDGEANAIVEANATAIPAPYSDNGGHGTHVAGIVAGRGTASAGKYTGVAPQAKLVGLAMGEVINVTRGLASFDWIHQHKDEYGIRVVTNSWGGSGSEALTDSLTYAAVEKLVNEDGLVVLFAAGNDGGDGTVINTSPQCNIPSVICVANYYDRTGYLDTSSSRGLRTNPNTWPDLAAPGTQIISTAMLGGPVTIGFSAADALVSQLDGTGEPIVVPVPAPKVVKEEAGGNTFVVGDYASLTGTSMATPFVAGVVALLLEANPNLTPAQVKAILRNTATMVPGRGSADEFELGTGVVDAAEAIAVALRMKDGADLTTALNTASVDFSTSPVQINFGTGPVADQTIPLSPGAPSPVTATGHVYQAGAIDLFGLTGTQHAVAGTPVDLAARTIASSSAAVPLTADNFTVTFYLYRGDRKLRIYNSVITADDPGYQATASIEVPSTFKGTYQLVGELTHATGVYKLFEIPLEVTKAG